MVHPRGDVMLLSDDSSDLVKLLEMEGRGRVSEVNL